MSTSTVDYDALAQKHGAIVDYEALARKHGAKMDASPASPPEVASPEPGFWDTLQREGKSLAGNVAGVPAAVYHAFVEPPTQEEKQKFGDTEVQGAKRVGLGIHRLAVAPVETAADWYGKAIKGEIPNAYEQALSVAPEAMGAGAAAPITGKIAEIAANAPAELASAVKPAVRTVGRVAGTVADSVNPDITGVFSPRLAHIQRVISRVGKAAGAGDAPVYRDATLDPNNVPEYAGEVLDSTAPEALQRWWKARGGVLASERPNGPVRAPSPKPSIPEQGGSLNITSVEAQPKSPLRLPAGQYEAPASPIPQQRQLGGQVLEGEYMPEPQQPAAQIRGQLKPGVYQQPGGFEPNQPALPQRGSPIQLPAASQLVRRPIIRTSNTAPAQAPLRPLAPGASTAGLPKFASDAIDQVIPPEHAAVNMMVKAKVKFYLDRGDVESAEAAIENAANKLPRFNDNSTPSIQAGPEVGVVPEGDMTDLLKQSLARVKRQKVMASAAAQ